MKNCVVPIGYTLKIGRSTMTVKDTCYTLISAKAWIARQFFRTDTTNCRLNVCVIAYCTTEGRNCQSTLHHSRLKVCGKEHYRRLKFCQSTLHNGRLKTVSKHSTQLQTLSARSSCQESLKK